MSYGDSHMVVGIVLEKNWKADQQSEMNQSSSRVRNSEVKLMSSKSISSHASEKIIST